MKEPNKIPLDPSTPKAKDVKKYSLNDTANIDCLYDDFGQVLNIENNLEKINKLLDQIHYEDSENSH